MAFLRHCLNEVRRHSQDFGDLLVDDGFQLDIPRAEQLSMFESNLTGGLRAPYDDRLNWTDAWSARVDSHATEVV